MGYRQSAEPLAAVLHKACVWQLAGDTPSTFAFLHEKFSEQEELGRLAERYLRPNPQSCLMRPAQVNPGSSLPC